MFDFRLLGYAPTVDPRKYIAKIGKKDELEQAEVEDDGGVSVYLRSVAEASGTASVEFNHRGEYSSRGNRFSAIGVTPYTLRPGSLYRLSTDKSLEIPNGVNIRAFFVPSDLFLPVGLTYAELLPTEPDSGILYVGISVARKTEVSPDVVLGKVYFFEPYKDESKKKATKPAKKVATKSEVTNETASEEA